ncbi:MAG: hypothetical protein ACTSWW_07450 [Promethearchaeota archaeon]
MMSETKRVQIVCPVCSSKKKIPIPMKVVQQKESGATSLFIPSGLVCLHPFYVYIDKNFHVRDYLVLEYSLQDEAKRAEQIKAEIFAKAHDFNYELDNILNFISEVDLRSLLYSCFIESPLILIEDDPKNERFGVIFNILAKLFPDIVKTCNIFTPEKYLEYSEAEEKHINSYTVYNVPFKLSVRKPFGDSSSEPFTAIIDILKKGSHRIQIIYAKNAVDYLRKFSEEISEFRGEKIEKVIKTMKKRYPDQAEILTPSLMTVIQRREEYISSHLETGELKQENIVENVSSQLSGFLFMYNDSTHIRQAESLPTLTEKLTLKIIRRLKAVSIDKIIDELKIMELEQVIEIEYTLLPEILDSFIAKHYIEKL